MTEEPRQPHRFDDAPGVVGIARHELPNLPDDIAARPDGGRVDPRRWFADPSRPLEIEIGSGKGTFLLGQARAHPELNLLGSEWEGEFYGYTADRVRRAGLKNVRVLHADATEFLRWRVPDGILSVIHLYFSDPWPKKRHFKRRVIQDRFLLDAHRVLVPGGELRVVTDHDDLWEWDLEHFTRVTGAGPSGARELFEMRPFVPPAWVGEGRLVGTNYERKFAAERPAHSCVLVRLP
jgi:tRNA (guanine-N7-)-methyltransferase